MAALHLPSKFQRPRLGAQTVPRARLLETLQAGMGVGLTLLSAPAGFGKSTLVAQWAEGLEAAAGGDASDQRPHACCAWLTLDTHDNEPVRFWGHVAAALQSAARQEKRYVEALAEVQATIGGQHAPPLDMLVETLLSGLALAASPVLLVFDDYQAIRTPSIHESLHFFISHLPEHAHVLLLTRTDPPMPLQRWRAYGQMVELRAKELCFTAEEAGALLSRRSRIVLPRETLAALVTHTDGWPVGLQLVAASLQGRSLAAVDRMVRDLSASSRHVLDYLMAEVLQSQPEPVRDFLLRTSILGRLRADLCGEMLEVTLAESEASGGEARPNARSILSYLESNGLFLIALDDDQEWFRYYHLFAEALQHELRRRQPKLALELHGRASRWLMQHGFAVEATEHALAAEEWEQAAANLATIAYPLLVRGDFRTLFGFLDRLPPHAYAAHPRLALSRAYQLLFRGPLQEAEAIFEQWIRPLAAVEAGAVMQPARHASGYLQPSLRGEIAALRAQLASFRWRVVETRALGDEALRWLPDDDHFARATVCHALGHAAALSGNWEEANQHYNAAIQAAGELGSVYIGLFPTLRRARVQAAQGRLRAAEQTCRRALRTALDHGGEEWPLLMDAHTLMAELAHEHNDLLAAEHYIRLAMANAPLRGFEITAWACTVQARVSLALGRRDGSRAALADSVQAAFGYDNPLLASWLGAHLAALDIAAGDVESARVWAASWQGGNDLGGYAPNFEEVVLARLALAEKRPRAALAALHVLEERLAHSGALADLIRVVVLMAVCHGALNQRAQAMEALQRALDLAEAEGFRRVFLDEGERIAPLLEALSAHSAYAASLLADLRAASQAARFADGLDAPLERLTPREVEILRALARGSSNLDIAETFVLTVGTVKGHVNHILGKLNARNRTEAVARARELGLI